MNEPEACPSEDVVVRFLSGRLTGEGVTRLERHAAGCPSCLDLISAVVDLVTPPVFTAEGGGEPQGGHKDGYGEGYGDAYLDEADPLSGSLRFGPFRALTVLGRGGIGIVYRAVHEQTGEEVAVKTVPRRNRDSLLSLHREIHALSQIHHPGVVRIIAQGDRDSDEDVGWYAMQLVEGQTLAARLTTVRYRSGSGHVGAEEREALLEIVHRLCSTLSVLHAAGFVHRDLSTRNIIIRPGGIPVLVDFGFALTNAGVTGEREVLQMDTLQAGTLLYTAPERFLGDPSDARSDIYSLGCILYEALTGRPPFWGNDPKRIIDAHLSVAPRPPSQMAAGVPSGMDELTLGLLAKDPRQRPAYADQVASALERLGVVGGSPRLAPPATPGYLYRPRLVGRQESLDDLQRLLDRCEGGGPGTRVFITGESGVGKTRLALELASRAHRQGMRVILGTSAGPTLDGEADARPAASALQPLRPFLQAVAEHCRTGDRRETLRLLGPRGRILAAYEPTLLHAPGLTDLRKQPQLAASAGRFRLFDALEHVLAAFCAKQPLILIFDDLQWADELTLAFLCEHLGADFFARHNVLIAATCREEPVPRELGRALRDPGVKRVCLPPLDAGSVSHLVTEMLGSQPPPEALSAAVASHACGNPLFVMEYLRTALSEQRLVRAEATWRLVPERFGDTSGPPPTAVRELVLRRLARLSSRAQSLVDLAAVLGREFPVDFLLSSARATLAGTSAGQPDSRGAVNAIDPNIDALSELVANQVLETADPGHYRFVHDKLREIAYLRMPGSLRQSHHALLARAIERHHFGTPDFARQFATLAAHFCAARDDRRARIYLQRAASRALRAGAAREAEGLCSRALDLTTRGSPRRAKLFRLRAEARFALADLPACLDDGLAVLREVCGHAPSSRFQWIRLLVAQGTRQLLHRLGWKLPGRLQVSPAEAAVAAGLLASVYYFTGDWLPMTANLILGANLAEQAGHRPAIVDSFARLGYVAGLTSLKKLAPGFFVRAVRMADSTRDLNSLALTLYLQAFHDLGRGRFRAAEATGRRALQLLEQVGDVQAGDIARTIVGHAVFFQGRLEEAGELYLALYESARRRANRQHMGWGLALRARSLLLLHRPDEALPLLDEARSMLEPLADRLSIVMCEGLLASAYLAQGRLPEAERVAASLTPRLRGAILPLVPCLHGYVGAASVAMTVWERSGDSARTARRDARLMAKQLERFARRFPMARPAAFAVLARLASLEGNRNQATRRYSQALQTAAALGLSLVAFEQRLI